MIAKPSKCGYKFGSVDKYLNILIVFNNDYSYVWFKNDANFVITSFSHNDYLTILSSHFANIINISNDFNIKFISIFYI